MAYERVVQGGGFRSQEYGCSSWGCSSHREWDCPRRCRCAYGFHAGIDITAAQGTPLLAVGYGTRVMLAREPGKCGGFGPFAVCIRSGNVDLWYGHCSSALVGIGAPVVPGQPIARMGSLGCSTGTHLHFEAQRAGVVDGCLSLDPAPYLSSWPGARPGPPSPSPPVVMPPAVDPAWLALLAGGALLLYANQGR